MKLSGSSIYLTSTFYCFRGVWLVHWTHSFCVFIIALLLLFFKMGYSIRKYLQYHVKCGWTKDGVLCYTKYVERSWDR